MSWDQQYSLGHHPNAQPPTPTQTTTASQFPETPRQNPKLDNRTGWTPTFAEEYTVFAQTPGRLTGSTQRSFVEMTSQQTYGATPQDRRFSTGEDIEAELASHVHIISNQGVPLPPVNFPNQLSSSPNPDSDSRSQFHDLSKKVTPKPKKRLEAAFSGQIATPPKSSSKGSRKLAPKVATETMQSESQENAFGASETPTHPNNVMSYTSSSTDLFGYPMSAPATAPAFTNSKPFWDPDTSMSGMELDFSADNAGIFNQGSHRISSSFDWRRNNQMFQDSFKFPPNQRDNITAKRQRPLAPKATTSIEQPTTVAPFDFGTTSFSNDPFTAPLNVLDPGLLYSRHNSIGSGPGDITLPGSRPATSHIGQEPYQHQLRELRRDQEELRLSRNSRERKKAYLDRGTVSSPVRGSHTSRHRSISENGGRKSKDRTMTRAGRSSPSKHQLATSLTSIPESRVTGTRTEVKLTIDANGRARTETVVIGPEEETRSGPSAPSEGWESSPYESSTDEDEIILPSRNTSFVLPSQSKAPKLAKFDTANRRSDVRRRSTGGSGYSHSESSSSTRLDGAESEAEPLMGQDNNQSGDATHELRKVVESRNRDRKKSQRASSHHYLSDTNQGGYYRNYSSPTNISPTTVTDPDGATPSSTRSGSTRCVCNNPESGGFMIQCESCDNWLHAQCVGIDRRSLPPVYICAFCAQTPNARVGRTREAASRATSNLASSPLAHKSFKSFR